MFTSACLWPRLTGSKSTVLLHLGLRTACGTSCGVFRHRGINCANFFFTNSPTGTNSNMATNEGCLSIDKVAAMRMDYGDQNFDEDALPGREPISVFDLWFKEATENPSIGEANAMTLATASRDGKPSARVVLMKGYSKAGFRFFTNYGSQKGQEIEANPNACLVFYWEPLHRQVRITGPVEKLSEQESTEYFQSRPRGSQIGALVSDQSKPIRSRDVLAKREKELQEKYKDESIPIPKPKFWGGFLVRPVTVEFWCGKSSRLHDRILFRKLGDGEAPPSNDVTKIGDDGWVYERLSP